MCFSRNLFTKTNSTITPDKYVVILFPTFLQKHTDTRNINYHEQNNNTRNALACILFCLYFKSHARQLNIGGKLYFPLSCFRRRIEHFSIDSGFLPEPIGVRRLGCQTVAPVAKRAVVVMATDLNKCRNTVVELPRYLCVILMSVFVTQK